VDDLLDISRISRDKLELRTEPVDLRSVMRDAVERCQPLAHELEHQVSVELPDEPLWLDGDPVRLTQVIGNLLSNACKYTPPRGQVWLSAKHDGSDALLRVRDTGIGIPPERLDDVFQMFSQLGRKLEREQGGLGIGLHLVKRLVEMHGGSVEARSSGEGKGSEFIVRLPLLREAPPPAAAPQPQQRAAHRPRRILVVDDNSDAVESLSLFLKLNGHQTETAHDGPEAVEKALQTKPEVVFLDIGLPTLSGYDVCRAIRRDCSEPKPLVIALTGWGQEEDHRRSRAAGFDGHLVKPVNPEALVKLLDSLESASTVESLESAPATQRK
jgi:CheY-like chemotaxis protein/two-component sensor histidine kinase